MNILVIGAGVLGSLYAGRLQNAGHEVTVLSRGERLAQIQQNGIILQDAKSDERTVIPVRATGELSPEEAFDLVLVLIRNNQIPDVLPTLTANKHTPNVLFMVNNAAGPDEMIQALGKERVILGFPGAGGQRRTGVVRYYIAPSSSQPTTIGELDGSITPRLVMIREVLALAGFPVAFSENMDAWLKTHVALVSPIANAIYLAGGDNYRLARTQDGLTLLVRGVKEGLRVLKALVIPITPAKMRILLYLPEPLLVGLLAKRIGTSGFELVAASHANTARDEMMEIAREFRELVKKSGLSTPALDRLYYHMQPGTPPVPEGSAYIPLHWGSLAAGVLTFIGLGMGTCWIRRRTKKH